MAEKEYEIGSMDNNRRRGPRPPGPGMRGTAEKAKDFKGTWKKLINYCRPYMAYFIIAFTFAVIGTIIMLSGPSRLQKITDLITDGIMTGIDLEAIYKTGIVLAILYGISFVLTSSQHWIMSTITQRVGKSLRRDISVKINRLPMSYYNKTSTGDVLSRITNDVDTICQSLNQSISAMLSSIVQFLGSLLLMVITNFWLTLIAIAACILGIIVLMLIMGRSQKYFDLQQEKLGDLNGHIEEIYAGHSVIKAYNAEGDSQKEFDRMNGELKTSMFRAQSLAGMMMPIMMFVGNLGYVAVCVLGGVMAAKGLITIGVIVAFMIYVRYFTQPLQNIAQGFQMLQSTAAAGERVFAFLGAKEMEDESGKIDSMGISKGNVEFSHVRFGYEPEEEGGKEIIHDFSASAKEGQKIAIVGPTGAGKTTLVNLLMRFYEVWGGSISIDGTPTTDVKREAVHEQFCMVLQDTWLFEGTIRENLVYCKSDVPDEKIVEACKAVGLDHYIRTLPSGYDTILNDQVNLSAGQKQQMTIARAMIADKPILILDEATSSVDTRTEQQIQSAMDELMENRTSFVIAHRLSTIKNADLILVLNHGDVVESGTHEDLLAAGGFYADLYNSQFEEAG